MLDSSQRFAIDRNIKKPTCYKVTQNDNSSYNYGKGLCCVTVSETQFNPDRDKLITLEDGKQVWVCDYIETAQSSNPSTPLPPSENIDETTVLSATISGNTNLKVGIPRTYIATLLGKDGNSVDWDDTLYGWNVVSNFDVVQIINENRINLAIDDEDFVGSSFLLQIVELDDDTVIGEIKITVVDVV